MRHRFALVLAALIVALTLVSVPFTLSGAAPVTAAQCSTWVRLIDVSDNNPHPIDWSAVARDGIAGVYIKNSENLGYANEQWAQDTTGASKAGIPWGGYYFAQPKHTTPQESAAFFVKSGGAKGLLPPALDLEVNVLSPSASVAWAHDFMATVTKLTGRTPIIYTGGFYPWSSAKVLTFWRLWIAAYPAGYKNIGTPCGFPLPSAGAWGNTWAIWQFTSVAHVKGIGGGHSNVDLSAVTPEWWSSVTGSGVQPPTKATNRYPAPIYATASHGPKVFAIQKLLVAEHLLKANQADSIYGPLTTKAVFRWQQIIGAKPDGLWSAQTGRASDYYLKHHRPYPLPVNYPLLHLGNSGHFVQLLQSLLNKHHAGVVKDGQFGPRTLKALTAFQRSVHLPVSGQTTPRTWKALWK